MLTGPSSGIRFAQRQLFECKTREDGLKLKSVNRAIAKQYPCQVEVWSRPVKIDGDQVELVQVMRQPFDPENKADLENVKTAECLMTDPRLLGPLYLGTIPGTTESAASSGFWATASKHH
jgi:hypothetical protein